MFLLQWAAGGLLFAWVTTRRREVGLGYGWLLRSVFATFAVGAAVVLAAEGLHRASEVIAFGAAALTAVAAVGVLGVSVARRRAGVSGAVMRRDEKRTLNRCG